MAVGSLWDGWDEVCVHQGARAKIRSQAVAVPPIEKTVFTHNLKKRECEKGTGRKSQETGGFAVVKSKYYMWLLLSLHH